MIERKSTNMTLIRFQPESADASPALRPGDMLRDFMNLHFPFFPQEKAGMNTWSPALDVHDGKDAFTLALESPGLKEERLQDLLVRRRAEHCRRAQGGDRSQLEELLPP
jgi:HSP20 family molecular chaperone IbpA